MEKTRHLKRPDNWADVNNDNNNDNNDNDNDDDNNNWVDVDNNKGTKDAEQSPEAASRKKKHKERAEAERLVALTSSRLAGDQKQSKTLPKSRKRMLVRSGSYLQKMTRWLHKRSCHIAYLARRAVRAQLLGQQRTRLIKLVELHQIYESRRGQERLSSSYIVVCRAGGVWWRIEA
ncbi:uncharacterized protein BDZ99DRAFT_519745 [Mytilinidion resinicola]|uniref:Uncharacterized protein n=1 Tax=Mytilinidion resinicola TaxID=574789 RepID=A0A6A6YRC6_9PEZI|nr:uncharacterized protein BDZ99DRAFT_519745 [Mytilinidion resinicola]KAF2811079.1 hypothetical protein BDZ99DRAFT_519745 [Mytilinidion resinicola]